MASIIKKRIINGTEFLGVLACDQLPKNHVCKFPAMLVVNTHPSNMPGEHWLAIYISKNKHGYFFDSFGNPPDNFPAEINNFIVEKLCGYVLLKKTGSGYPCYNLWATLCVFSMSCTKRDALYTIDKNVWI